MTTIRSFTLLAAAAAALAAFASFGAAAQGTPIRSGVVTPLSGTYAGIGQQVK